MPINYFTGPSSSLMRLRSMRMYRIQVCLCLCFLSFFAHTHAIPSSPFFIFGGVACSAKCAYRGGCDLTASSACVCDNANLATFGVCSPCIVNLFHSFSDPNICTCKYLFFFCLIFHGFIPFTPPFFPKKDSGEKCCQKKGGWGWEQYANVCFFSSGDHCNKRCKSKKSQHHE